MEIENTLRVIQAKKQDRDKKTVKLSANDMVRLDLQGSCVKVLNGDKFTVAQTDLGDVKNGTISLPVHVRNTIGVKVGDAVKIERFDGDITVTKEANLEIIAFEGEDDLDNIAMNDVGERFAKLYCGRIPMVNGDTFTINFANKTYTFDVRVSLGNGVYRIAPDAEITVADKRGAVNHVLKGREDVGGLDKEWEVIENLVILPTLHPEIYQHYGKKQISGLLLYGPPGSGKTLLVQVVSNSVHANFIPVSCSEIFSKMLGESENRIRKLFDEAKKNAPSILFFDEVDALLPKRDDHASQSENRVVSEFLTQLGGLDDMSRVMVIAATNRPNALDPAVRRPGRLEKEIEIPAPDEDGRREIFEIHLRGIPCVGEDDEEGEIPVDVDELARITNGFVGADIYGCVREGIHVNLMRNLHRLDLEKKPIPDDELEILKISHDDMIDAVNKTTASALREITVEVPHVTWSDVGGLEDVKQQLIESVVWNIEKRDIVAKIGIPMPKGLLMYGPPGSGKTLLAKATANQSECNFIYVKGPEFLTKWVGETERKIREVFSRARSVKPCIIFIDEFDAIAPVRGSNRNLDGGVSRTMVAQLLTEMDGIEKNKDIIVIAATNRPDMIDPAILRTGRIDRMILVPAPDPQAREKIIKVHLKEKNLDNDIDTTKLAEELAKKTENFSGSDIEALVMEAGIRALRNDRDYITEKDFDNALEFVQPSLDAQMIDFYDKVKKHMKNKLTKKDMNLDYMT